MPLDDAWDWPLLLYSGTTVLKRAEREFWRMTPRKLQTLVTVHVELNKADDKQEKSPKQGYIDQIF